MEMQCVQSVPGTILFLFYLLYFYFIFFTFIYIYIHIFFNFRLPRSYAIVDDNRNLVKVTKINTEEDPPQMITSKHKQTLTVAM